MTTTTTTTPRYYMFTDAGDLRVERMVQIIAKRAVQGQITRPLLPATIREACNSLSRAGFEEVWDTEPQYAIADQISKRVCEPQMWLPIDRWDW